MKCPKCNGSGEIKHDWLPHEKCHNCGGSGYVDMTNEEYLRSCDTEQLAEFIIKAMLFYDNAGITVLEAIKNAVEDKENLDGYFMERVLEWLKQPHKDGES